MSIKETINNNIKQAMRDKNQPLLESLRLLKADIQRKEVDERIELDDEAVVVIVQKMIKQLQSAIDQFAQAGRQDLVDKDEAMISVLQHYLPEQLNDDEIAAYVTKALEQTGASEIKDMGKVMAWLKPELQGRADMSKVGPLVKQKLS